MKVPFPFSYCLLVGLPLLPSVSSLSVLAGGMRLQDFRRKRMEEEEEEKEEEEEEKKEEVGMTKREKKGGD